jgi:hypothetical protein
VPDVQLRTLRHWVVLVFGAVGLGLLPWTIWLSSTLRPEHVTHRWDIAWSGFDAGLALMFLLTAFAAWRRSPWLGACATATGTLLLTDVWFDVILESRGHDLDIALFEAIFAEVPAALVCFWIAYRTEQFLARAVDPARASHLTAAGEGAAEGNLVGVLEVASDGEPAREPGHPDASA